MFQYVIAIGNVGMEPTVKTTQGGRRVTTVRLATTRRWYDFEHRRHERTEWHTVEGWEGVSDILADVHVGDLIAVSGYMKYDKVHDKFYATLVAQQALRLGGSSKAWDQDKQDLRRLVMGLTDREVLFLRHLVEERLEASTLQR
jgi:single-strand DNA-binding protein